MGSCATTLIYLQELAHPLMAVLWKQMARKMTFLQASESPSWQATFATSFWNRLEPLKLLETFATLQHCRTFFLDFPRGDPLYRIPLIVIGKGLE